MGQLTNALLLQPKMTVEELRNPIMDVIKAIRYISMMQQT